MAASRLYEQPGHRQQRRQIHRLGARPLHRKAKKSDYWKDTLFLVVADHDIRVRGETLVPIERFHIPGLILAPTSNRAS